LFFELVKEHALRNGKKKFRLSLFKAAMTSLLSRRFPPQTLG